MRVIEFITLHHFKAFCDLLHLLLEFLRDSFIVKLINKSLHNAHYLTFPNFQEVAFGILSGEGCGYFSFV